MRHIIGTRILVAAGALATAVLPGGAAIAKTPAYAPNYAETRDLLWALEQSIYATRAKGSMAVILDNVSPYLNAWPITSPALHSKAVRKPFTQMRGPGSLKGDKEQTQLFFIDMAFDGHTAVMMYKTHKTRMSDGTPADDYFEVTHVWSNEAGKWRLLSNRPQPVSPPES